MRLRIPTGVATATREDGSRVVEVYVATPNGISNRLLIPVKPTDAPPPSYALRTDKVTLAYNITTNSVANVVTTKTATYNDAESDPIVLVPAPSTNPLPTSLDLTIDFDPAVVASPAQITNVKATLRPSRGDYLVDGADLANKIRTLESPQILFPNGMPRTAIVTKAITVTPQASGFQFPSLTIDKPLTISFKGNLNNTAPPDPVPPQARRSSYRPTGTTMAPGDSMANRTSFQAQGSGVVPQISQALGSQIPSLSPLPSPSGVTVPTLPSPNTMQSVVVIPPGRAPVSNINITMPQPRPMTAPKHQGLLRRRASATPSNPTRPPLSERIRSLTNF